MDRQHNAMLCLGVNWAICTESPITPSVFVLESWFVLNRNLQRIYSCISNLPLLSVAAITVEVHRKIGYVQMIAQYLPVG